MNAKLAYFVSFLSLLLSIIIVNVGAAPRQKQCINIGWKFNYGDVTGAQNPAFVDNAWKTVNLPHIFQ